MAACARAEAGPDQYIELHFQRDPAGRWLLRETAALPGVGVQSHLLEPAEPAGNDGPAGPGDGPGENDGPGVSEWRDTEHPELLAVRLTPRGERHVIMEVVLRGKPHVRFQLARVGQ
jgi:hypothetical protein